MYNHNFGENAEFCSKCLTHDKWWTGGGSWAPDRCPRHNEDDGDAILWKNMSILQKRAAAKLFAKMWKDAYGVEYKFSSPPKPGPDTRALHEKPGFLDNVNARKISAIKDLLKHF